MKKRIIIAAVSARPFVQAAAAAGYEVISLDAFADIDTRNVAKASHVIGYGHGHFDEADLKCALNQAEVEGSIGLVYGGGLEAAPDLLEIVERHLPLIGNTPRVLRNLKRPRQFFILLEILKIPHPEVSFKPVISDLKQSAAGWLYKQGGGSGGTHVRKALPLPGIAPETGCYFQREIKGVSISLLFVADSKQAKVVGFNQQWTAPAPNMPYRYGGAVGNVDLPDSIRQQLIHAAQQLTNAVGLRGLNSLDAVMDGEQLWVLEINPRLSATFDLYQSADCNLFELHVRACAGDFSDWVKALVQMHQLKLSKAHHIVYAPYNLLLPGDIEWPEWVADVPVPSSVINMHDPVCTVIAEAETAKVARELVFSRRELLETMLADYEN